MQEALHIQIKEELLKYIQSHLDGDLSIEKLSRISGYSVAQLHRIFLREVAESPGSFVKRKRIESAAMLLGLTSYPVHLIRELVGYKDEAAFARAFKQHFKSSPRKFRKQNFFDSDAASLSEYISLDYQIEYLPDWDAVSHPEILDYFHPSIFKSWESLIKIYKAEQPEMQDVGYRGIMYECPNISGKEFCRFDATLSTANGSAVPAFFNSKYPGGKYAVFTFCAPFDRFREITLAISDFLLNRTKLKAREGFSILHYIEDPLRNGPDHLLTKWYFPVL